MPGELADPAHSPLRVLMTADAVGGVWQYAVDLIRALNALGNVEILLATCGPRPSSEQKRQFNALPSVQLFESDFPLEWMPNPWGGIEAAGQWLLNLDAAFHADLIHLNGFSHATLPWGKPVLSVAHSCVHSWWRAVHNSSPGNEWAEYKQRVGAGLTASTVIVAPSQSIARSISEEYGLPSSSIHTIYNSSDLQERDGKQKDAVIFAAGRLWDEAKNLTLLEKIAPNLDWPVRIAGSSDGRRGSVLKTASLHLLGVLPHEKLQRQLESASIFAHPALYEPFGLAVLEAARARCCLVLSDIPSLRELWAGAAVFIDPRDPELWQFELNELSRNFTRRRELAERAVKHARRYSGDGQSAEYQQIYSRLLRNAALPGVAA